MLLSLVLLPLLVGGLLLVPSVQNKLVALASEQVQQSTGIAFQLGSIRYKPLNSLELKNIYIPDQQGDTLLYIEEMKAGFSLLSLLKNRLEIKHIEVNNYLLSAQKDSLEGEFNFQFIVDALASPDSVPTPEKEGGMDFLIHKVHLHGGRIHYDVHNQVPVNEGIDYHHLAFSAVEFSFSGSFLKSQEIDLNLQQFSFVEAGGFELKNMSGVFRSLGQEWLAEKCTIHLPNSSLLISQARLDYTGIETDQIAQQARVQVAVEAKAFLPDFVAFAPELKSIKEHVRCQLQIDGDLPSLQAHIFDFSIAEVAQLQATASIDNYLTWETSPFRLDLSKASFSVPKLSKLLEKSPFSLPEVLNSLGECSLQARLEGSLPALQSEAQFSSAWGSMQLKAEAACLAQTDYLQAKVQLASENWQLSPLLADTIASSLGFRSLVTAKVLKGELQEVQASLVLDKLLIDEYRIDEIEAVATYLNDSLQFSLVSADKYLHFDLAAQAYLPKLKLHAVNLEGKIHTIDPSQLPYLSASGINKVQAVYKGAFTGSGVDDLVGSLQVDNFRLSTDKGEFVLPFLELGIAETDSVKNVFVHSDMVEASFLGRYTISTLATSVNNSLHRLLPSVFAYQEPESKGSKNEFSINLSLAPTQHLSQVLNFPFALTKVTTVSGRYQEQDQQIQALVTIPNLQYGSNTLSDCRLSLLQENASQALLAQLQGNYETTDTTALALTTTVFNDSVQYRLDLGNPHLALEGLFSGKLAFSQLHEQAATSLHAKLHINPSEFSIQKQRFNLAESTLTFKKDFYEINKFTINQPGNGDIIINGKVSNNRSDSLLVSLSQFRLDNLIQLLQLKGIELGAVANGGIVMKNLLQSPFFVTNNLSVQQIKLNKEAIGDLAIRSVWSERRQGVMLDLKLLQENNKLSSIRGFALPYKDSLQLKLSLQAIDLAWFKVFTQAYLSDIKGELGCELSVSGKISKPNLNGYLYVENSSFTLGLNKVNYSISDSIYINEKALDFQRFVIKDSKGNAATISGKIQHERFEQAQVNLRVDARNFLLLDNPGDKDSLIYGSLSTQASFTITGTEKGLQVGGNIREGTSGKFYLQIPQFQTQAQRYENIEYVEPPKPNEKNKPAQVPAPYKFTLPIQVSVAVALGPSLQMGLILNPSTHDAAWVKGKGSIQCKYSFPSGDMKLLGNYTVDEGKCVLSLKNITKREFQIESGSKILFKGEPLQTYADVKAVYSLRTDLNTLDNSFSAEMSQTRVKANCILGITGDINQMDIDYSVVLPDADETVQRRVNNLLYSNEIKIKQVAYLLATNSFYPLSGNQSKDSHNIWTSLASSTLSSQLNNLLSGVLNENWSIATTLQSDEGDFSDVNMEVNVSAKLFHDRLIVNTNLGYNNDKLANNAISGDVVVEYKLIPSGALRLKVYNITNDDYFKTSPVTQGLSLIYRKEAQTFKDLFTQTLQRIRNMRPALLNRSPIKPETETQETKPVKEEGVANEK